MATKPICIYCDRPVKTLEEVPQVDDDQAWHAISLRHKIDCEWVLTRAHRRPQPPTLLAQRDALLLAAEAVVRAIASRENTMGDPSDYLNAKHELQEATKALRAAIQQAKGGT